MAVICQSAGQRLCFAQRNQPQRPIKPKAIRTGHALRLVSDTTAVRTRCAATVLFNPLRANWNYFDRSGTRYLAESITIDWTPKPAEVRAR
jgi:hypothetical protein